MSTKRKIGVSTATTEAARRQLMQPVPCWEKVWSLPQDAPPSSALRVYKWVKTDKKQNFSDDEEEPDLPLVPLPDEPETQEGDDDMEQDDQTNSVAPDSASRAVSEPVTLPQEPEDATPAPPKRHPLSMSLVPGSPTPPPELDESALNTDLNPLDPAVDDTVALDDTPGTSLQVPPELELGGDITDLDMTQLGPDGEPFEGAGELAQLQPTDTLLGGEALDESSDPFNTAQIP
ncbi:uncharacterized protein FOMMEDRAFT_120839 [Fomitiporia mediterranea MF3/22]|uniref:uncharacterized protein n=1 Tax=Fomitiporia mediterranea (strain MF3/22) TaxID=694068 RepID=UPI00044086E0|nr:uncharacterized protein FOMMEDRAFT_120839 [Fomitiporia mediterranea MF3/22]EJD03683.1 hypothetical protein FOMMEDRAFT_120839 [Fomitiporia mediterranea MF3/22]